MKDIRIDFAPSNMIAGAWRTQTIGEFKKNLRHFWRNLLRFSENVGVF